MIANRQLLKDTLGRLAPRNTAPAGLPDLPQASGIDASTGVGVDSAVSPGSGGGGGVSLGAASTVTITSSDGVFTWSVTARAATLSNGSVVELAVVG